MFGLHSMLFLDNDMEYFVEPRMLMTGSSRDDASLYRSRTSLGTSMGAEADWEILPEDIMICKDPYGRDWQLGTGGFGSVSASVMMPEKTVCLAMTSPGGCCHKVVDTSAHLWSAQACQQYIWDSHAFRTRNIQLLSRLPGLDCVVQCMVAVSGTSRETWTLRSWQLVICLEA